VSHPNRDRGRPRDLSPPTPPYIRVTNTAVRSLPHARHAKALVGGSPRPPNTRSGLLPCKQPLTGLYDRSGLRRAMGTPTMPSADSSPVVSADYSARSPFPWHAPSLGTGEASRGKLPYRRCIDAGCIKHRPLVDGGLHGRVPARPDCPTPCIRFVSLAPPLRATLPSDPTSR
jgi:hypothetical protein